MGRRPFGVRWIDSNKGDDEKPNYRSRLVGREIKKDNRLDLFSATPPLEALKLLLSMCAKKHKARDPWRVAVIDIKRAYFYAPTRPSVFIEIPSEDYEAGDECKVAHLKRVYMERETQLKTGRMSTPSSCNPLVLKQVGRHHAIFSIATAICP